MNLERARDRQKTFVILAPRKECGCVTRGDLLTSIYVIFVLFIVRSFVYFFYFLLITAARLATVQKVPEKSSFSG